MTLTPAVARSWGTGGRSLRTVTRTAAIRSSRASRASAISVAERSSRPTCPARHDPLDLGDDRAVVDRVGQVVAGAGRGQVDVEIEVDLDRLGPLLLLGQHADERRQPEAAQLDPVLGHPSVFAPGMSRRQRRRAPARAGRAAGRGAAR